VVDDKCIDLIVAEAMSNELGCEVVAVASGQEALSAVERQDFEVALIDCQMPGMDGFETTRLPTRRRKHGAISRFDDHR